jgi:hypothetical protein
VKEIQHQRILREGIAQRGNRFANISGLCASDFEHFTWRVANSTKQ